MREILDKTEDANEISVDEKMSQKGMENYFAILTDNNLSRKSDVVSWIN